jgi:hypothetical protein
MSAERLPPRALARIEAETSRQLSAQELAEALAVPLAAEEIAERRAQIAWFCRRYPTARERLAWCRRAHARWTARRAG